MKTMSMLLAAAVTVVAFAADAPAPKAEDLAKNYAKLLTRVTEKPQMIGRNMMFYDCARPADYPQLSAKFGPHLSYWANYYRNDLAQDTSAAGALPVGSVIVKEKQNGVFFGTGAPTKADEATFKTRAIAGMIKRPAGTFPKSGDWEFFWFEDGKLTTTKLESCAGCHSGAKRDYVFTELPKKAK